MQWKDVKYFGKPIAIEWEECKIYTVIQERTVKCLLFNVKSLY